MANYVVAWYELDRAYGGAEEGGWWFDTGELVRVFRVTKSEAQAYALAGRANGLMHRLQRHRRDISSMAYSGGRYGARVYENKAPEHFPGYRPVYD